MKDWEINIYRGVLTGFNDAFIISEDKKNEILSNCLDENERKRTAEIIRPILRGRDIKRYGYDWAGLYLINAHNGVKEKEIARIDIEKNYPSVKAHLDKFWDKISNRTDKGDTPYNLRNCAYMDDFFKPKICWGNLNLQASYCIAPEGMFVNAPCPMIVPASNYLLAVLNSRLADYYIRTLGVTRNGGYFEYKPMFVEQLPIPRLEDNSLFSSLDENPSIGEQRKINQMVYSLYNLTEEEILFIENQL